MKVSSNSVDGKIEFSAPLDATIIVATDMSADKLFLNLQAEIEDYAVRADRLIIATDGLTGGGDLTGDRIISHEDTSDQPGISTNVDGNVIQNVDLDDYGHVTSLSSIDLDDRYVTNPVNSNLDLNNKNIINVEGISLNDRIYHTGDTDTYIKFDSDTIRFYTENSQSLFINSSEIRAYRIFRSEDDVVAFYSDERLKDITGKIENPIEKINSLNGFYYKENDLAKSFGYNDESIKVGLSAQEVESVLPEIVKPAPFDVGIDEEGNEYSKSGEEYKTIQYEKLVPLLVEAIKELSKKVEILENGITN
mgnify:CR=1 FL=1